MWRGLPSGCSLPQWDESESKFDLGPSEFGGSAPAGLCIADPCRVPSQDEKDYGKPEDQLDLTEEDKEVDIERMLSAKNPDAPLNHARFSYKDRSFQVSDQIQVCAASRGATLMV